MPESGSGQETTTRVDGWDDVGDGWLRPDPNHESYPTAERRRERGIRKRLGADPNGTAALEQLRIRFGDALGRYRVYRKTWIEGNHEDDHLHRLMLQEQERLFPEIITVISDAATRCAGEVGAHHEWVMYFVHEIFPTEIAEEVLEATVTEPVLIRANATGEKQLIPVDPGQIIMRFSGASQDQRNAYNAAITEIQKAWGFQKDQGGRPRNEDDPVKQEQARTVAKLANAGWSATQIAAFMDWNTNAKAADAIVGAYETLGIELLNASGGWPPPEAFPREGPPRRGALQKLKPRTS